MLVRKDMWKMYLNSFIMIFIGFSSGIGVAAGTFAFLLVIRVIPRMIQKAKLGKKIVYIENIVIKGIMFGTVLSLFTWKKRLVFRLLGQTLLTIYGFSAGIFAGCVAVALAEILDTFPIFFRRLKMKESDNETVLYVMAIGKMIGSLFYFLTGYGIIN